MSRHGIVMKLNEAVKDNKKIMVRIIKKKLLAAEKKSEKK